MDSDHPIIVALETSGRQGSVALARGPRLLRTAHFATDRGHAVDLLPAIDRLCTECAVPRTTINEVYVSGGPGSFTGLRIAVTFAKAMALADNVRTVRVPTLEVIAQNAWQAQPPPDRVGVVLDARRRHVYAAVFVLDGDLYRPLTEAAEYDPVDWLRGLPPDCALVGEGLTVYDTTFGNCGHTVLPPECAVPRAESVQRLGWRRASAGRFDDPAALAPIYVRRPQAEEQWARRHGDREETPN